MYVKTDFIEHKKRISLRTFITIPELYDNSRSFMIKVKYSDTTCLRLVS